jgi:D-sedoheptulose 7-phosphate isomerase
LNRLSFVKGYIDSLRNVLSRLEPDDLVGVIEALEQAYGEGAQVFLAGNGGSAATALHMATDLMKGVRKAGSQGFRVISLTDNVATITAIANDEAYEEVFAGQLLELADPGDLLIVLSGSGNSPNIIRAIEAAKQMRVKTVGFLGMGGGRAAKMVDLAVIVPADEYGPVEDAHLVFDHLLTNYFQQWVQSQLEVA